MKPKYCVTTWDFDLQQYTPQIGVRTGPYSLWGLRKAVRKLRSMGYSCYYSSKLGNGNPSVYVSRCNK